MSKRLMGIDPGDKRIGIAISDETATIANPYQVLQHVSRAENARRIAALAEREAVCGIIIGRSITDDGEVSFQGRKSQRLGDAILALKDIPILYWSEDFTTNDAIASRQVLGVKKQKRQGHFDAIAATILLQDFLNSSSAKTWPAGSTESDES